MRYSVERNTRPAPPRCTGRSRSWSTLNLHRRRRVRTGLPATHHLDAVGEMPSVGYGRRRAGPSDCTRRWRAGAHLLEPNERHGLRQPREEGLIDVDRVARPHGCAALTLHERPVRTDAGWLRYPAALDDGLSRERMRLLVPSGQGPGLRPRRAPRNSGGVDHSGSEKSWSPRRRSHPKGWPRAFVCADARTGRSGEERPWVRSCDAGAGRVQVV